jgi:hypothetical protein
LVASALARRKTKRNIEKALKEKQKSATIKKEHNEIINKIEIVSRDMAHPRRPRSKIVS